MRITALRTGASTVTIGISADRACVPTDCCATRQSAKSGATRISRVAWSRSRSSFDHTLGASS